MTYPPGPDRQPGQDRPDPEPEQTVYEYPSIEYQPTPPPGYPMPPPGYPPPPGVYGPPPAHPPYHAPRPATNQLALASLVCSLVALPTYFVCIGFALSIAGIVLGIVALNQIDGPQKGKEMALTGIIVGGVGLVGVGLLFGFT